MVMEVKHVQAKFKPDLYAALQETARQANLSLSEAIQEATVQWLIGQGAMRDPWDELTGIGEGARDASKSVDDIYLGD